jgi:hypothetical protein
MTVAITMTISIAVTIAMALFFMTFIAADMLRAIATLHILVFVLAFVFAVVMPAAGIVIVVIAAMNVARRNPYLPRSRRCLPAADDPAVIR